MRMIVKSMLAVAGLAGLAAVVLAAGPANALPIPGPSPTTNADIACVAGTPTGPIGPGISYRAWGTGYPANAKITVQDVVTLDGATWSGKKTDLVASASGAWSTTTTVDRTATRPGLYEYNVLVTDQDGKVTYGKAYDACKSG